MSDSSQPPSPRSAGRGGRPQRATIADVARLAGVSTATVSRVLNGSKPVGETTAAAVQSAAHRLGFHPSRAAQLLARSRTRSIGLVISDLFNETLLTWARAAEIRAQELGYQVILSDGRMSEHVQAEILRQMLSQRVDAIYVVGPVVVPPDLVADLSELEVLLAPSYMYEVEDALRSRAHVETEAINAAAEAVTAAGIDWMVTVSKGEIDDSNQVVLAGRRASFFDAIAQRGVDVDPFRDDLPADAVMLRETIRGRSGRGLVVGVNHDLPGLLTAAAIECGKAVPGDVAIIVFGDSRAARSWPPRTSVIARDMALEGRRHIGAVIEHLENPSNELVLQMEPAQFIPRQSTPRQ